MFDAPASTVVPKADITLREAYAYISSDLDALRATHELRRITDKAEHRRFKATHFRSATFSGTFSRRSAAGLIHHSGLLCVDFDHVGAPSGPSDAVGALRRELIADPHFQTLLAFRSPSGDGLKGVVGIDLSRGSQRMWVDSLVAYCTTFYHHRPDAACSDVCRSCFLPFDAECYLHPDFRSGTYREYCPF